MEISTATPRAHGWVRIAVAVLAGGACLFAVVTTISNLAFETPYLVPWAVGLVLVAVATGVLWWRRPERRSNVVLRIAFRLSSIAFGLMVVLGVLELLALVALFLFAPDGIGPKN